MTEKLSLAMITDYGKDEDATEKMLAKNKVSACIPWVFASLCSPFPLLFRDIAHFE